MPAIGKTCPQCGHHVPAVDSGVPWCDCGWNLAPSDGAAPRGPVERLVLEIGRRRGETLLREVRTQDAPAGGAVRAVLVAIALGAILSWLALVVVGIGLLIWHPSGLLVVLGLLLLGLAWLGRPRFGPVSRGRIAPEAAPGIHGLVRLVAQAIGTSPPDAIVVDHRFNASAAREGWRHEKVLRLGLPLMAVLERDERVSLIGHELAHFACGDPMRGLVVSWGEAAIYGWYLALRPAPQSSISGDGTTFAGIAASAQQLGILIGHAASLVPLAVLRTYVYLGWQESQLAEYRADRLGAAVSGTRAYIATMEKLLWGSLLEMAARRAVTAIPATPAVACLRQLAAAMPERERERYRRIARLETSRLDASHPPTAHRIENLLARPVDPALRLSEEQWSAVDADLQRLEPEIDAVLADQYRRSLYE